MFNLYPITLNNNVIFICFNFFIVFYLLAWSGAPIFILLLLQLCVFNGDSGEFNFLWHINSYNILHIICQVFVITILLIVLCAVLFMFMKYVLVFSFLGNFFGSLWAVNSLPWGFFWVNDIIETLSGCIYIFSFYRYHTFFFISFIKHCFFIAATLASLLWYLSFNLFYSQHFNLISQALHNINTLIYIYILLGFQKILILLWCATLLNVSVNNIHWSFFYLYLVPISVICYVYYFMWATWYHIVFINIVMCAVLSIYYFNILNFTSIDITCLIDVSFKIFWDFFFIFFFKVQLQQYYYSSFWQDIIYVYYDVLILKNYEYENFIWIILCYFVYMY